MRHWQPANTVLSELWTAKQREAENMGKVHTNQYSQVVIAASILKPNHSNSGTYDFFILKSNGY